MARPYPLQLRGFLAEAYKTFTAPASSRPRPLTFVVGNESAGKFDRRPDKKDNDADLPFSADLDSLCSAILYAYLRSQTPPNYTLHIPLLNLPRDDLPLRPEFSAVLQRAGIDSQELATLSELEKVSDLNPEDTRWILVDHNRMTDSLRSRFGLRVVGCVDHHVDEGAVPEHTVEEPRVIEKTKSCMSLVVRYCSSKSWQDLSKDVIASSENGEALVQQLVDVALAPILIDSGNSREQTEEYTKDHEALSLLGEFRGEPISDLERDSYFEHLLERKIAIENLSLYDNFRKDYKVWKEAGDTLLGMSTIPQGPEYIFEKMAISPEKLLKEFRAFAEERELDIACIMLSSPPDPENLSLRRRWLLVWALNEKGTKAAKKFYDANHETLGLVKYSSSDALDLQDDSNGEYRHFWRMEQAQNTRKQVGPMIRAAIQESARL